LYAIALFLIALFLIALFLIELQGGQDLNLQPAVLETAALPIEPPPYVPNNVGRNRQPPHA
jgi:hypothetical protein